MPKARPGELLVKYGKDDCGNNCLVYCWPDNTCGMKSDSRVVMDAFERQDIDDLGTMTEILKSRGYDITTLKFSIKKLDRDD